MAIAWQLARLDIVRRYTATMLGVLWAILAPLLMAVVIGIVFGRLFRVELAEFLPYLFLNLTLWAFFSTCIDMGAISFIAAEGYIKQIAGVSVYVYPLRMVLAAFITLVFGLIAVTAVCVLFGRPVGVAWLLLVPGLLIWVAFGFAVACLSGVFNTAVRDLQHVQSVVVQALFYATPVMFPAALLVDHGLSWMLTINPLYHLMMLLRVPMLFNGPPPVSHVIASLLTVAVLLGIAAAAVKRAAPRLVFWL